MGRWVLHVDLDQFVVAVELRRRPELRGLPVLVGGAGDPTQRGVVAGASYEAREHGVRSGTPLRTAARRCPDAFFLPLDRPAYEAASQEVRAVLVEQPGVLEPLGWDEAFLGVETDDPLGRALLAQAQVRERTGLACSVGAGDNRLRAKTATGFAKPGGVFLLTAREWPDVMGPRPCEALWGVGARTARTLAGLGLRTVADLAAAEPRELAAAFGPVAGPRLRDLARGESSAEVRQQAPPSRSRGRETTFPADVADAGTVARELVRLVALVCQDLDAEGRDAARVVVVLRTRPFRTRSRGHPVRPATRVQEQLERVALGVLAELLDVDPGPVRLVGVRAELVPAPDRG